MRSIYYQLGTTVELYEIVRDTPSGTISISGAFTNLDNCKKELKKRTEHIKSLKEGPNWGLPYIMKETIKREKLED